MCVGFALPKGQTHGFTCCELCRCMDDAAVGFADEAVAPLKHGLRGKMFEVDCEAFQSISMS